VRSFRAAERGLLGGGLAALAIKIGAAGLQFLMFLALARAMLPAEYGLLGFGFSLATLLAVIGSLGFRMLSLRFLQIYQSEAQPALVAGLLRDGFRLVPFATLLLAAAVALGLALIRPEIPPAFLGATIALALALALAEYLAFVLRGFGRVTLALAPRDLAWRGLVALAVLPAVLGSTAPLSAAWASALLAALLALVIALQIGLAPELHPARLIRVPATYERARWRQAALGLWGVSVIQIAAPNLVVVVLGLVLSPAETGGVFAALRIAGLLNLVLLAANMVAAPTIARACHEGRIAAAQAICAEIAATAGAASAVVLLALVIFGRALLGLFGAGFEAAYPVLLIAAAAYVVNTLTGPTSVLLEVSGHERAAFGLLASANLAAIVALPLAVWAFGAVGAALCLAVSVAGWNLQAVRYARRRIGVDPSILGLRRGVRAA